MKQSDDTLFGAKKSPADLAQDEREAAFSPEYYTQLLLDYLDICNKVMAANRHRFPYRQIWAAGEQARSGDLAVLALYDEAPKARCIVSMGEKLISVEQILAGGREMSAVDFPVHGVALGYVMDVLKAPDKYVADPSLINWDWLKG